MAIMRRRKGISRISYIPIVIVSILVIVAWILWSVATKPQIFRTNIILVSPEHVRVVSISGDFKEAVSVLLPADTVIDAAYGYGKYSLESLLKLDELEHGNGRIYIQSIQDALGVPIDGFIHVDPSLASEDPYTEIRNIFSLSSIGKYSLPLSAIISIVLNIRELNPAKVSEIPLAHTRYKEELPDQSVRYVLDTNKADYTLGNNFYDISLRSENVSVEIYNTTQIPSIGQKTARLLTHVGISVLQVGNSDENLKQCQIVALPSHRNDVTVRFLMKQFDCMFIEMLADDSPTIQLKLGDTNGLD